MEGGDDDDEEAATKKEFQWIKSTSTASTKALFSQNGSSVGEVGRTSLAAHFLQWIASIIVLRKLKASPQYNRRVLSVSYERFVANPGHVWNQLILPFCGLETRSPTSTDATRIATEVADASNETSSTSGNVPRAMLRDSQKSSILSQDSLRRHSDKLLPEDVKILDEMIKRAGIADGVDHFFQP